MKDLVLESRYIHTGNSGITFKIQRDVENPQKAHIVISNQAMGGFSTKMDIHGADYGFTSQQLRDFALMFLESANSIDEIKEGKWAYYQNNTPHLFNEGFNGDLPYSLKRFQEKKLLGEETEKSLTSIQDIKVDGSKIIVKNYKNEVVATVDRSELINDRLKDLTSKL